MGGVATGSWIRPAVAIPLAGLGALAGRLVGLEPWALLATAALIVGIAQQTLP
ncbi:hypothetical protein FHR32_005729 [Streptosporangium album]|uniref:Uncharacterized protein n=1 Tax=Streptosporangium album TaxID=47479 RepID=A0A7W7WBC4_9ACTN|nr:hypothetical protein [Streptosporangium album]MBB4941352.1 hypothetical protein [Streptosporangium album]